MALFYQLWKILMTVTVKVEVGVTKLIHVALMILELIGVPITYTGFEFPHFMYTSTGGYKKIY